MKIDFSKAKVLDLDGNPILVNGVEVLADHKYFANMLATAGNEQVNIPYLDRMEIAMKINKGEVVDLEKAQQDAIKDYLQNVRGFNGLHIKAFLSCLKSWKT